MNDWTNSVINLMSITNSVVLSGQVLGLVYLSNEILINYVVCTFVCADKFPYPLVFYLRT